METSISYGRIPIRQIRANPHNARTHSKKQIQQIVASIKAFGFTSPCLVDEHNELIGGHGRLQAAESLGLDIVPVIVVRGLSKGKKRALMLADNKIALGAGWDREKLAAELLELPDLLVEESLELSVTGFETAEIDTILTDFESASADPADEIDPKLATGPKATLTGDIWRLGNHLLMCGDARDAAALEQLLDGELAHMAMTDPPYNVAVRSIVGRGARKHREFAMASGEMSSGEFQTFLAETLGLAARFSTDGAVHFVFMDWRHFGDLVQASLGLYGAMLNTIVWVKTNAGQGSFYRSQHELIGVFRVGEAPHRNNVELGRHGRNRTNVWQYAGANSFRAGRLDDLRAHPTVKPVAMVAEAIKDCTRRSEIVLDTFCGSGTTLLAAERVGRRCRGLELDPIYVDLAVRRWQAFTGRDAVHATTGLTFEDLGSRRRVGSTVPVGAPARQHAKRKGR